MAIASFIAYSIALGIAAAIPGPGVAAIVSRALGTGFARTLPMVCGLILGDVVYLILAIAGLSILAQTFSGVFFVVKIAGATYLLYLAYKFWTAGIQLTEIRKSAGKRDAVGAFLGGFAVTMANPKTIVFYMALLPTVVDIKNAGIADTGILVILTVLVLFVTILPYAALASKTREAFKRPATLKALNRTAAGALGATATWILAKG